ncbi:MAG: hypothetical protein WAU06_07555, partial [Candidatus Nanopelagicales bacterium]
MEQVPTDNARPDRLGTLRPDVRVGAYLVLLSAIVGLAAGWIWSVVAPRAEIVTFDGKLGVDNFAAAYIGADMTYGLLMAGAGLL